MTIKGIAFDMDGVIADTAKFHSQAWRELAERLGVTWTPELAEALKGVDRVGSLALILAAGGLEGTYTEAEKDSFLADKNTAYLELIATLTPADVLPGMAQFLADAQAAGYRLAVASASRNAPVILERLGLMDYFAGLIVDPATLSKGKPDPEIFVRAAEVMGLPSVEVVGLEDAQAGVAAINGAGEVSVGIGDLPDAQIHFETTEALTLVALEEALAGL